MTNPESFERMVEIFEHARDLSRQDRSQYLSKNCDGQPLLHDRVRALLEQHDRKGLLDNPIPITAPSDEPMPQCIGGYRIIEPIGRGGMGVVYRAEQDHPRRQVAVKVVHAGLLTPEMRRRFEFESSVLARLMHPGIAVFFEVGTWDDGHGARPYFAMELVDGLSLDRYLKQEKPSIDSRLRLFIAICDAVHHAHQKGVIHRDLKPDNILVCADGTPKILDFGVARTTEIDVLVTQHTQSGQILGTLAYMSPEQINSASEDVDTRSDVYALGVILYELLAGRLPYNLSRTSIAGAARIIEESQPPSLSSIYKKLNGDLNTITHKALCKAPSNRYQSVSDLAADLRRFLNHEPISARPATAAYHARRFARRHRGLVSGMFCVVLVVILGSAGFVWQASRVNAEAQTRREIAAFLSEMLTSVDPAKTAGEPLTVRDMLDDAAANLHERFDSAPIVRGELHTMVGQTYYSLGDYAASDFHLRMAIDDLSREKGSRTDRWFLAMTSLGLSLYQQDRLEEAESILLDAQDSLRSSDRMAANRVNMNLALVLDALGRTVEAETIYREAYIRNLARIGPDAKDTLLAQNNLGTLLMQQDRFDEALPLLEDCLRRRRVTLGDDHPLTISTLANLAALYSNLGRDEEMLPMLLEAAERSERVLGPVHLNTLHCRHNIVVLSLRKGDFTEAAILARALLETIDTELDPWHPERLGAIEITVTALALGGDSEAGEALALESYRLVESNQGPKHRSTGRAATLLFNLYDEMGDTEQMDLWRARIEASDFSP